MSKHNQLRRDECESRVWMPKTKKHLLTISIPMIGYHASNVLGQQLIDSKLRWFWCCWRKDKFPWDYSIHLLTSDTLMNFVVDVQREWDMCLYFIDLFGFDSDEQFEPDHSCVGAELIKFYGGKPTSLKVLVQRLDDELQECTYVSVARPDETLDLSIRQLMHNWGIEGDFTSYRVVQSESYVLRDTVRLYNNYLRRAP